MVVLWKRLRNCTRTGLLSRLRSAILGYAYALSERLTEALPLIERSVEQITAMRSLIFNSLFLTWLSEAHLLAGRIEDAVQVASRALDFSHRHKEQGNEAWALRLLGEISSRRNPAEVEDAEEHYRKAIVLADELGMRPLIAHCNLGLGKLYRRTAKQQAKEHLNTAIKMMRDMEMGLWLERAEGELKSLS